MLSLQWFKRIGAKLAHAHIDSIWPIIDHRYRKNFKRHEDDDLHVFDFDASQRRQR